MSIALRLPAEVSAAPSIRKPYLIFLADVQSRSFAKTAFGVRDWLPDETVGQWRMPTCAVDLDLPELSPAAAVAAGARSLLIGVAAPGGQIPAAWAPYLIEALHAGLDLVNGLHTRLSSVTEIAAAARAEGRALHDVRHADRPFPIGTGRKRSGKRALTVGTDCALGKKYTALALTRALKAAGIDATFRATGQTGIMIAGEGVAIDAVVSDFVAGAAESLSPDAAPDHWDIIEGQGALHHPAYAGVTLGLIHGSQPDALVLCHDPKRTHIDMYPWAPIPTLRDAISMNEACARVTNPKARVIAIALNTFGLSDADAQTAAARATEETGLPAFDPIRFGIERAVQALRAVS
ncbi:MAG: DUF1611 domain-containing protein [Alphaproteobacteria bacterium]|nr:DUF1611 domain-containing protein [Alphaproteobacteria bacterium]